MKMKVSLTLNAKRYDIDVEEDFARFLILQMKQDFNFEGNNDLKLLLQAYVRKNFALYEQEKQALKLIEQIQTL
ncbi:MAG: hypothetical protein A2023_00240 [Sulfuricurvum sp. GWF2_44_89]|jgi:hypothetical protein|uniref:Uncharacterized protein n=1 Tax=Sulfuricurvum kujiense TaxID=148813 RepID=A0A2D3WCR2_9BACT|nr:MULTISPECIES: hypothetical protein [Sulfuricurvum]OHD78051.1 MAG: hypothetical protein A2023_00240 [Sulfuricurvum sp. GWF2_44_89]OHD94709.1 MAG: hypothetical protein A2552_02110 [Sulfuricurvum sp. RIFOXYD2_FULL_44_160]OHD95329.1 MAG: hypothetical protein A2517_06820 [Sulfuricurvum sp. RIFOXYD12_FULL_44_77]DAB38208.1 MAG TPA: hypothetical protein CFH83_07225 [Sulfuricurvum kujiense]